MMKKFVSFCIILLFSAIAFGNSVQAEEKQQELFNIKETDRVIVKLKKSVEEDTFEEYSVQKLDSDNNKVVTMEVPEKTNVDSFINELENQEEVLFAEPDYLVKKNSIPNDLLFRDQWFHRKILSPVAWNKTFGASDITVAVIDDGIDLSHVDLKGKIVHPFDMVKDSASNLPVGEHGTHVAGIIGATADNGVGGAGIAPNTSIMPINVFDGEYAYTSDLIDSIYYAVENGANIINMSLGSYNYSSMYNQAIQYAYEKGVLIISAAGNDSTTSKSYPAAYDHVISVSSIDEDDSDSWFSNYGSTIDIAAPGSSILSTAPGNKYEYMNGTSMASPVVAGVAALVWANEPSLTNKQVANRLFETADDLGESGKDILFGYGKVNAKKALMIKDLPRPFVNTVSDHTTVLKGSLSSEMKNITVTVKTKTKKIATIQSSTSNFSINIPKQPAGIKLYIFIADPSGNTSKSTIVTVVDKTLPVITGTKNTTINVGSSFSAKTGVKAIDNADGDITKSIKLSGEFNRKKIGIYTVLYKVQDKAGNKTIVKRTITVKDQSKPKITGAENTSIKKNTSFNSKKGVTAKDNIDGNITNKITVTGTINTKKVGTYTLTYTVIDKAGNKTVVKRKITVK